MTSKILKAQHWFEATKTNVTQRLTKLSKAFITIRYRKYFYYSTDNRLKTLFNHIYL